MSWFSPYSTLNVIVNERVGPQRGLALCYHSAHDGVRTDAPFPIRTRPNFREQLMQAWCKRLTESRLFQNTIIALIVINGLVLGLETSEYLSAHYGALLSTTNSTILGLFVLEVIFKLIASWPRPQDYFRDGWNVFG